ncbi:MAG: hypothetical protein ACFFC6_01850 [Promethearchaeota archaeon]
MIIFDRDLSLEITTYLQRLSSEIDAFFSTIFPILLCITIVTINLSIVFGALVYLLDHNENNGKMMIVRSLAILTLIIFIFNPIFPNIGEVNEPFEGFLSITSYITAYMLFIFASLSLIIFLGNLGLYIISSDTKHKKALKKSVICILCVVLPMGFQFPNMPLWRS